MYAFPEKLIDMVTHHADIISFENNHLIIRDKTRLTKEIIPIYTKCTDFQSIMRQFNYYGFTRDKKKISLCTNRPTDIVFVHPKVKNKEDIKTMLVRIDNKKSDD